MNERENQIRIQARESFANHKATVQLNEKGFIIIDWRNENGSSDYYVQYIIDSNRGALHICGDLGDCISCWYNPVKPEDMVKYVQNIGYWMGKFQATSDDYTYNSSDIETDLNAIREEYLENKEDYIFEDRSDEEINDDFDELIGIFNEYGCGDYPYQADAVEIIEKYNEEWWEGQFSTIGKRVSTRVYLWAEGLKLAWEQIKDVL